MWWSAAKQVALGAEGGTHDPQFSRRSQRVFFLRQAEQLMCFDGLVSLGLALLALPNDGSRCGSSSSWFKSTRPPETSGVPVSYVYGWKKSGDSR